MAIDHEGIPFPITDPERIAAKRYYDEEFYRLECERLWPHVWQMACRLEQIQNVGDWIEYTNLDKSVIVVRTKDGVKAYHNACRHRGVKLARGHGSCEVQGFTCPFHGWRWNIDGKNTFVYGRGLFSERQLEQAELDLPQCRIETWGGCAFINFDDDAPSFRETIGPVAERLEAHNLHRTRAEWCYATILPANWKLAMEAFMEGYHVMRTHPQLYQVADSLFRSMYEIKSDAAGKGPPSFGNASVREMVKAYVEYLNVIGVGMAGMAHAKDVEIARSISDVDLPEDPAVGFPMWLQMLSDEVTKQGRARGEPTPDLNVVGRTHPVNAVEYIFPHIFFLPTLSSFAAYRTRPLGPESCLFEIWSLTLFPEGQEPAPVMDPVVLPYDSPDFPPIPQQDYSNIPRQQEGLHAGGFEYMRLSGKVEGLIGNYHRVIDGFLCGAPPKKLAAASSLLGGNFDGPVLELGL
ncbi:MAG TPA: aromatic ring-hydroxylating dioxygenase subunit alpha [Phenylobacterium sp.]|uniref:aromatic ring-hydroxylating oxygenase subunit alpha n=1 Tax=Phenylobacterium sp. TaxID=1871053 RepID=UPI002B4A9D2B|nr:aromatic ring-hydroxylating dioxygenase subunit alpha [Phenylobacterium sp.]HKR90253.1 aromatic ring-hydroxylating dioxygenase subunit alpha [Phenylobacterium sp.]